MADGKLGVKYEYQQTQEILCCFLFCSWRLSPYSQSPPNARAKPYFRVVLGLTYVIWEIDLRPRDISPKLVKDLIKTARESDVSHSFLIHQFRGKLTTSWSRGFFENKARPTDCSNGSLFQCLGHSASPKRPMKRM